MREGGMMIKLIAVILAISLNLLIGKEITHWYELGVFFITYPFCFSFLDYWWNGSEVKIHITNIIKQREVGNERD
jgi:hypothetical protein